MAHDGVGGRELSSLRDAVYRGIGLVRAHHHQDQGEDMTELYQGEADDLRALLATEQENAGELLRIGGQLANVAYNLGQHKVYQSAPLPGHEAAVIAAIEVQWIKAVRAYNTGKITDKPAEEALGAPVPFGDLPALATKQEVQELTDALADRVAALEFWNKHTREPTAYSG
jgi:hypothetical protein